jgi:hypothetical protein
MRDPNERAETSIRLLPSVGPRRRPHPTVLADGCAAVAAPPTRVTRPEVMAALDVRLSVRECGDALVKLGLSALAISALWAQVRLGMAQHSAARGAMRVAWCIGPFQTGAAVRPAHNALRRCTQS